MLEDQKAVNKQICKLLGFTAFALFVISTHIYDVLRDPKGMHIDDSAISTRKIIVDHYHYYKNVKSVLHNHDAESLNHLVNAWCGGGAGCYSHGGNLVQILERIGDKQFSEMCATLSRKERQLLGAYLSVGYEYGNFSFLPNDREAFYQQYPKTVALTFNKLSLD